MACMGYSSEFSFVGQNFLPWAGLATNLADRNLHPFFGSGVHYPYDAKNCLSASMVHRNQVAAARFRQDPSKQRPALGQVGREGRFVKDLSVRVQA
jgi:hypothetical protein